jgi:hypothetical protein
MRPMTRIREIVVGAILDFGFDPKIEISYPGNHENDTYDENMSNFRRRHLGFWF